MFIMLGIRDGYYGQWAIRLLLNGSSSLFIALKLLFRRINKAFIVCHVFLTLLILLSFGLKSVIPWLSMASKIALCCALRGPGRHLRKLWVGMCR